MAEEERSWGRPPKGHAMVAAMAGLFAWDLTWKLIALWKAARRRRVDWYIPLALINSVGILPIIYVFAISPHQPEVGAEEVEEREVEVEEC